MTHTAESNDESSATTVTDQQSSAGNHIRTRKQHTKSNKSSKKR